MKTVKFILPLVLAFTACMAEGQKFGQGGNNAAQFVRENYPSVAENAKSIRAVQRDSVLSAQRLINDMARFAIAKNDFLQGKISKKQYNEIVDERILNIHDVEMSWNCGISVNDSLKKLNKYEYGWYVVYTVEAEMKSGVKQQYRVLMQRDGIKPSMTDDQVKYQINKCAEDVMQAIDLLHIMD